LLESFRTLDTLALDRSTVLIRADLNVPIQDGEVVDDFRIRASLATIAEAHASGGRVVVASHLGRPAGIDPDLSLAPVAQRLDELSGFDVMLAPGVIGDDVRDCIESAPEGTVVVLENTRFEDGEATNSAEVADGLADLADVFINDAFGTAHRAHASNVGVAERLPSASGRLMEAEVAAFDRLLGTPDQPFVVAMGGSKISDKLKVIENLLPRVDLMLIGGGMCFTLLEAIGFQVGSSLVEDGMLGTVERLLKSEHGDKLVLPTDVVIADRFASDADVRTVPVESIPNGWMGLDIGPETAARFGGALREAASIFWNGPMGVFEWEAFRAGTEGVAEAVAASSGYTVIGGGDSVAAIRMLGIESAVSHVSSGGGAGLAMLEGAELPGLIALTRSSDGT
jgi:phosphoglycerate kinase